MTGSRLTLSPRALARALGVSESTVRRWIDRGDIPSSRTTGGHRRVRLPDAIAYVRRSGLRVAEPELLGVSLAPPAAVGGAVDLQAALLAGDASRARALLEGAYLAGEDLAALFDRAIGPALARVGELWRGGGEGILAEHRATAICVDAVHRLRAQLPAADGPVALGGAVPGDPYLLPSLMASAVLAAEGFETIDLGPDTPFAALEEAVRLHRPRLVWISASVAEEPLRLEAGLRALIRSDAARAAQFVVGGRAAGALGPRAWPRTTWAASMAELAALGRGMRSGGSG